MTKYLVLDIETNGIGSFRPPTQQPTQLAWKLFDETGKTLKEGNDIVLGAKKVKKFTNSLTLDEINEKGIPLKDAVEKMNNVIDSNTKIFAHNAEFDIGLLQYNGFNLSSSNIICTQKKSTNFCKLPKIGKAAYYGGYKYPQLHELADKLNINIDENKLHDASYDCEVTKKCVLKGIELGIF